MELMQQATGDVDINAAEAEAQSSSHRFSMSALHGSDSKMGRDWARTTKSSKLTVQRVTNSKRLCAIHFD